MKKIILIVSLLILVLQHIPVAYAQQSDCRFKKEIRTKGTDSGCTEVWVRGTDPTSGEFYGCPLVSNGNELFDELNEVVSKRDCTSKINQTVSPVTPAAKPAGVGAPVPQAPVPVTPPVTPPETPAVIPEAETAIRNYCNSKLNSANARDKCFTVIKACVAFNSLTTCLTAYDPEKVSFGEETQQPQAPSQNGETPSVSEAIQPTPAAEEEIVRTVTEVWLQTGDGEDKLYSGGRILNIRFPVNKLLPDVNELRVKIVYDKPDKDGSREQFKFFKVKRAASQQAPQTTTNNEPKYDESCWQTERNECLGCGISRTVEKYTCKGTQWTDRFRTKPGTEGQKDADCVNYQPADLTFLRNECTGCVNGQGKARRVDQCPNGLTTITQLDVDDNGCNDRCEPERVIPCDKEDLAFYCEGDEVAVYKYRDESCRIQFKTVPCKNIGQVCKLGDCVNE